MARQLFLSFRPEYFRPLLYNIKKYEYRKKFCTEPATAFLYLSSPLQEVVGIVEFGTPMKLQELLSHYQENTAVHNRILCGLGMGDRLAIPILSLQLYRQPITLAKIQQEDPKFHVPQSYLDMEKKTRLRDFLLGQPMYDLEFQNSHSSLYEENLGYSCREMELFEEFEEKDRIYRSDPKYDSIRSGYLTRKHASGNQPYHKSE